MTPTRCLASIAVLLLAIPAALAWGPISHYYFACNAVQSIPKLSTDYHNLYIGADLPDGMWNGWFLSGTECEPIANHYHSPIFAGYLISQALWNETYGGDEELLSFAVGYATHNIADQVGFAPAGGYLGNLSQIIDWSTEWPFMLSIDSYVNDNLFTACSGPLPSTPLSEKGVEFMAEVAILYNQVNSAFPLLNSTQIAACSNPWAPEVNHMNQYASQQLPATTAQQLVFFDRFGATDEAQAVANMQASFSCINAAHQYYFNLMFEQDADPTGVFKQTMGYVNQLYAAGNCTVAAAKHSSVKNPKLAFE